MTVFFHNQIQVNTRQPKYECLKPSECQFNERQINWLYLLFLVSVMLPSHLHGLRCWPWQLPGQSQGSFLGEETWHSVYAPIHHKDYLWSKGFSYLVTCTVSENKPHMHYRKSSDVLCKFWHKDTTAKAICLLWGLDCLELRKYPWHAQMSMRDALCEELLNPFKHSMATAIISWPWVK